MKLARNKHQNTLVGSFLMSSLNKMLNLFQELRVPPPGMKNFGQFSLSCILQKLWKSKECKKPLPPSDSVSLSKSSSLGSTTTLFSPCPPFTFDASGLMPSAAPECGDEVILFTIAGPWQADKDPTHFVIPIQAPCQCTCEQQEPAQALGIADVHQADVYMLGVYPIPCNSE